MQFLKLFREKPMRTALPAFGALALGFLLAGRSATAADVNLLEHWQSFNVTVLGSGKPADAPALRDGDMWIHSDIEGPVYVAGDLHNGNTIGTRPVAGVSGEGLVVGGDLPGSGNYNINDGNVVIGGTIGSQVAINMNSGGTVTTGAPGLDDRSALLRAGYQSLSQFWAQTLTPVDLQSEADRTTITAPEPRADGDAIGVLDLSRIATNQNINAYDLNGADSFIINVPGTAVTFDLKTQNIPDDVFDDVIWNFYEADSLTINGGSEFAGSILAPFAAAETFNNIEGSHVFGSLTLRAQAHLPLFAGDPSLPDVGGTNSEAPNRVPLPGTALLILAGLAAITQRRRLLFIKL